MKLSSNRVNLWAASGKRKYIERDLYVMYTLTFIGGGKGNRSQDHSDINGHMPDLRDARRLWPLYTSRHT